MPGLTSSPANTRADRGFRKAGFAFARTYDPGGPGRAEMFLFLRELCELRDLRVSWATDPLIRDAS